MLAVCAACLAGWIGKRGIFSPATHAHTFSAVVVYNNYIYNILHTVLSFDISTTPEPLQPPLILQKTEASLKSHNSYQTKDQGKKALVNSTSTNKLFESRKLITNIPTLEPIEEFPRLDNLKRMSSKI